MVLAAIQEVREKPSVWEPPRGWSPDVLTDPCLAKLGRFKARPCGIVTATTQGARAGGEGQSEPVAEGRSSQPVAAVL